MSLDATAVQAHKNFKHRLEINGYASALIQKISGGKIKIGVTKHAGAGQNFAVQEAGGLEYEPMVLETIVPLQGTGANFLYTWLTAAQDASTGDGGMPAAYFQQVTMQDLNPDGTVLRTATIYNAFCSEIDGFERDSLAFDKNTIDKVSITFSRIIWS